MTQELCLLFCLVLLSSHLNTSTAAFIPLRALIPATSTYQPSTLLLPPGFESQKAPPEPMRYPYAVPSTGTSLAATKLKGFSSTTPDWIPVALNPTNDVHLKANFGSTTATPAVAVLQDRISNDEPKYSSPVYKEGPVFESIVYGTWKPDPPLQPLKTANAANHQQQQIHASKSSKVSSSSTAIYNGKFYNKTINRQHGGFIGTIQHKPFKIDRQISLTTSPTAIEYKRNDLTDSKLQQRKVKKQGRRKIRPIISTTEENSIQNGDDVVATARTTSTTREYSEPHQNVIKVNSTDPKLMEVVKQINESLEIKYNHKQTSTHSIDMMMTTAVANNERDHDKDDDDDDEADDYGERRRLDVSNVQWATKANDFLSTQPQLNYDDDDEDYANEEIRNINATRRSWPTDFIKEPATTTDVTSYQSATNSDDLKSNHTHDSELPLALSALNIPASLWPKLPGNITKLGTPYEAESSAEEPALCVPITVREQNIMNSNELIYIERIFCFPLPLLTTSEKSVPNLAHTSTTSSSTTTTLKTVATTKVQSFDDFVASDPSASKANYFRINIFLVSSFLVVYLKFII